VFASYCNVNRGGISERKLDIFAVADVDSLRGFPVFAGFCKLGQHF
jgi:hypothetical protein